MKIIFFSCKKYEEPYLEKANINSYELTFIRESLSKNTAALAEGYDVISIFANDDASSEVLEVLHQKGINKISIRSVGYDNADLKKANELNMRIANVPEYSPEAVAEHAIAMMLSLSRNIIRADKQIKEHDYSIDKLIGFNLNKKTIGIIGVGKIGLAVAKILKGFGCNLLGYDIRPDKDLSKQIPVEFTTLENLCRNADIISIHTPLTQETKHLIDERLLGMMKYNVMIINTARGAIVNTKDIIKHLKSKHIGYYGMDVYEKEKGIFFINHLGKEVEDADLLTLMNMSNVLITPHQAFATTEAIEKIAEITFHNISCWSRSEVSENEVTTKHQITVAVKS